MSTEEKIILAFIYKRSGKDTLPPQEIYLPLSIELNWLTTKEAQQFLKHCINEKLLKETPNGLHPTFDVTSIHIPNGFTPQQSYPNTNVIKKTDPRSYTFQTLLQTITENKNIPLADLKKEILTIAHTKNIHLITAAILYAKQHHVSVDYKISDIKDIIFQENE